MGMKIGMICVGSELLIHSVNTNVHLVNGFLKSIGEELLSDVTVPDSIDAIKSAFEYYSMKSEVVIISGGLGPTFDDLTRDAVSEFLNRKLIFSSAIWQKIENRYRERGFTNITENNKRQAYIIEDSMEIPNANGTASGMIIDNVTKKNDKITLNTIILLPGPPNEMYPMMEKNVLPYLINKLTHKSIRQISVCFFIAGISESIVEEKTEEIRKLYPDIGIKWTILARPVIIELWAEMLADRADEIKDEIGKKLKEIFEISYIGTEKQTLQEILCEMLKSKRLTLAVAESCTGGLIGHLITEVPGSSEIFSGSLVTYSNILKKRILKVSKTIMRKYGAVSQETVIAMAKGAKKAGKSKVSLAVTGIAGPTGNTPEKPVGMVWMAVGFPGNRYVSKEFHFTGNRTMIKLRAALSAIDFLRKEILASDL